MSTAIERPTMFATDAIVLRLLKADPRDQVPEEMLAERAGLSVRGLHASMGRLARRPNVSGDAFEIVPDRWIQR